MRLQSAVVAAHAAHALGAAHPKTTRDSPRPWVSSQALQDGITTGALMGNLQQLDAIASANGGNRAFGYAGFAASVEYILSRTRDTDKFDTWVQDFPALFNSVESIAFSVANTSYHVIGLSYSPSTPVEGVTSPLVLGASGPEGCTKESYDGLDVKGKIALVQRGACPDGTTLAGRLKPAAAAGAVSVIIYSDVETPVTGGTLSNPNPDEYVPGGYINKVDGEALAARIRAGEAVTAYFQQTQTIETKITQNIFTETKEGDPHNVIMLGGHLDSVVAGPGINDDGSGSSLVLEVKTALEKFRVKNKVRFAWWGAEENGLLGSKAYVASLNTSARNDILTYLNFDMVSRGYFGVFDGDGSTYGLKGPAGSDVIEKIFVDDLTSKGINVTAARFTGGSDYQSFFNIGKPVGGLHTGTGVDQDACYHQACDVYGNANPNTLTINAKAAAHVVSILAMSGTDLIPKSPANGTMVERRDVEWTIEDEDRHLGTCGHNV